MVSQSFSPFLRLLHLLRDARVQRAVKFTGLTTILHFLFHARSQILQDILEARKNDNFNFY